jgi:TolB-like protein/Tfp pilus assembly protein PilF
MLVSAIRDDASHIRSVAVLPFDYQGPPSDDSAWLSEGLADELMMSLDQIDGLVGAPRTSSFASALWGLELIEIARKLDVGGIVEGTFRFEEKTIRVTATLIDGESGRPLWRSPFRAKLDAAEPVQDVIARAIAAELKLQLTPDAARALKARRTTNEHARELYYQGRYFWARRAPDSMAKAIDYFNAAIAIDSAYALAWSGLANAYALSALFNYMPQNEAYANAKTAALRAIRLEPNLPDAHVSLARALHYTDWDLVGAENEFKTALRLEPDNALAHGWYGVFLNLAFHDRSDEALPHLIAGAKLEPFNAPLLSNLGRGYLFHGRYDEAEDVLLQALAIFEWHNAHLHLGRAYLGKGRYAEAVHEFEVGAKLTGNVQRSNDFIAGAGEAFARMGQKDTADAILKTMELAWKERMVRPDAMCALLMALDQNDRCLGVVEEAIRDAWEERPGAQLTGVSGRGARMLRQAVNAVLSDPIFEAIRNNPRILRVRREHGLQ